METIDKLYLELSHVSDARNFREYEALNQASYAAVYIGRGDIEQAQEAIQRVIEILRMPTQSLTERGK